MPRKAIEHSPGEVFHYLTLVKPTTLSKWGDMVWTCQCKCGKLHNARIRQLRSWMVKSCGCYTKSPEYLEKIRTVKHGYAKHPLYHLWHSMIHRCTAPNDIGYDKYGGRGIRVCQRWMDSIEDFISDVGPRPSKTHTLDRIDNNGHYEPNNVRWATKEEQAENKMGSSYKWLVIEVEKDTTEEMLSNWKNEPSLVLLIGNLFSGSEIPDTLEFVNQLNNNAGLFKWDSGVGYVPTKDKVTVGSKHGRLTLVRILEERNKDNRVVGWFRCDCGSEKAIQLSSVAKGATTSCGCYQREKASKS